ncbi:MAG: hypothetical protein ABSA11_15460 [Candidatus Bathyarchaeia archaeon]|jgi:hypothetical protein
MVDAQTIGVLVTATSVTVAAVYYIMTLRTQRMNMKNTLETRRIGVVQNMMTALSSFEGQKAGIETANFEWKDYEDFERKYGTDNDVDAAAKRFMLWQSWNGMGLMLRRGMIEAEDLYDIGGSMVVMHWKKWEPIVQEIRRRYWGSDYLRDFEYLNDEMMKIKIMRDSSYKVPETFFKYVPDK